jgi:hypothetical protein
VLQAEWNTRLCVKKDVSGILMDDLSLTSFVNDFPQCAVVLQETVAPFSLGYAWSKTVRSQVRKNPMHSIL